MDNDLELVKRFVEEMTRPASCGCPATEVYQAFCKWHEAHGQGLRPMSQTAFGRYAEEAGVKKALRPDGAYVEYLVDLRAPATAPTAPAIAQPEAASQSLQVFNFEEHGVRIHIDDKGEPWFCANAVTNILGYVNGRKSRCRSRGR